MNVADFICHNSCWNVHAITYRGFQVVSSLYPLEFREGRNNLEQGSNGLCVVANSLLRSSALSDGREKTQRCPRRKKAFFLAGSDVGLCSQQRLPLPSDRNHRDQSSVCLSPCYSELHGCAAARRARTYIHTRTCNTHTAESSHPSLHSNTYLSVADRNRN